MKRRFSFFILLLALCSTLFAKNTFAQDSGWVIDSFGSAITVQSSGAVSIDEKIAVDFRDYEKHGIYRDIPYVYQNDDGSRHYTEIAVSKVLQDGASAKYDLSRNDNNIRIKIGDANKTLSGKHTYEIVYSVTGVLQSFPDHDELYWNVTGNDWDVHILEASAVVSSEKGGIEKVLCYQGYSGSTTECVSALKDPSQANFAVNGLLGSNEGVTIVVGYEKGLYPILTVAKPKSLFEKIIEPPSLLFLGVLIVSAIGSAFLLWLRNGRDSSFIKGNIFARPSGEKTKRIGEHETVVVEYEPPEKLRPAEIGVLTDERADTLDVVATIIDLAGRGYLTITEVPKKWLFGSTDYVLAVKKLDATGLAKYETLLFDKLFDGKKEVKVSSLKQKFYEDLAQVKTSLYERVVEMKFFPKSPDKMRTGYILGGVFSVIAGFVLFMTTISSENPYLVDLAIGIFVLGISLFVVSPFMSKRTAAGSEMSRRVKGYRLFIATAEKYRQRFFEKKNLFNEVLPYAIVFGLTEKFAQAMKDIGLPEKQMGYGWYYGAHAFNYATFSRGMNDFSNSLSSAIASSPKSSGFSGGGSSGGGFGGGGGGSW